MSDKEMLLIAYGAMKSSSESNAFIVDLLERHLAVSAEIEKMEQDVVDRKESK